MINAQRNGEFMKQQIPLKISLCYVNFSKFTTAPRQYRPVNCLYSVNRKCDIHNKIHRPTKIFSLDLLKLNEIPETASY
jgi:hypothetical protein